MLAVIALVCLLVLAAAAGVVVWRLRQRDDAGPSGGNPYGDDRWTGSGGTAGGDWGPGP